MAHIFASSQAKYKPVARFHKDKSHKNPVEKLHIILDILVQDTSTIVFQIIIPNYIGIQAEGKTNNQKMWSQPKILAFD